MLDVLTAAEIFITFWVGLACSVGGLATIRWMYQMVQGTPDAMVELRKMSERVIETESKGGQ